MSAMQVLSLAVVLCTLQVGCWSRRRRSSEDGDKVKVRRSVVQRDTKMFNYVSDACVYTRKLEMCGIQLSCSCCNSPTFGGCWDGHMIGYKDGIEEEIIEDTQNFSEEAQIDPLNKLADVLEHELSDEIIGSHSGNDPAKCPLYQTFYLGEEICLPWNFLAITDIIDTTTKGECAVILPNKCGSHLDPAVEYWGSFIIGSQNAAETIQMLRLAGHQCTYFDTTSELHCVL